MENNAKAFFISRAGADGDFAAEIAAVLEEAGYVVSLQQWDFTNKNFMDQMHEALKGVAVVVALLSPEYLKSEHCQAEWLNAIAGDPLNRNGRLILFRVVECEPPGLLSGLAYWDLVQIRDNRPMLADVVRNAVLADHHDATPIAGPYWRAPRTIVDGEATRLTPSFTGRASELAALSLAFDKPNSIVALHGMGGTGKSALAREYARRNSDEYAVVWWLNAETEIGIIERLVTLGSIFVRGLDSIADRGAAAQQVITTILSGFAKPILLIFENLENENDLLRWCPQQGAKILVTSRKANWGGDITAVPVDSWPIEDATLYLRRQSGREDLTDGDARAIAETLGGLPLALAHAAAFLKSRRNVRAESYLERIATRMSNAPKDAEYPRSVFATFQEQLGRAEADAPGAAAIMCLLAFFAPEAVPEELFQQSPQTYPNSLRPILNSEPAQGLRETILSAEKLEEAFGVLDDLSLIDFFPDTRTCTVHRLVQLAARELLGTATSDWGEAAITILDAAFPDLGNRNWDRCARLLPHVQAIVGIVQDRVLPSEANLVDRAARYLLDRSQYSKAEPLFVRALELIQCDLGEDHPTVAVSLANLASLYVYQGRYVDAESLYLRALEISECALGRDHPAVAMKLNNLASLYHSQGRYADEEPLYVRALEIRERSLGGDHPTVATSLNSMAGLYQSQGRFADAEPLNLRALEIKERALGRDHPEVAISLDCLAALYSTQGRFAEAEPFYVRALEIRQLALGGGHPDVATSLNNLTELYRLQGRYAEAAPLIAPALDIREREFGGDHPDVAMSLNNLASYYQSQGRYADAEPLYVRALEILERALGEDHNDVATMLNNLAVLYTSEGRYAEAEPVCIRSLEICKRALGEDHPDVAASLSNLATLFSSQGRYTEAEPLCVRALEIYESALGADHPDVATALNNVALLYGSQGRFAEAEPLFVRALEIYERALGGDHPDVAMSLTNLAAFYRSQGLNADAEPLYLRALDTNERVFGGDHPDVATCLSKLGVLYSSESRYAEAELLFVRALEIRERTLGGDHPLVATSLNNLVELYQLQGRYADAEPLYLRALEIRERAFGGP